MNKNKLSQALFALTELIEKLRGPDGCPWDVQQTDSTIKMYLLEEAYEVLDAIERGSTEDVCQELGDLLFQIIFICNLAEERGEFDLVKVMEKIKEKMINRHPHVFGLTDVKSAEEVADNWARIKKTEKDANNSSLSVLQSVPLNLPALLRAHRLSERASKVGVDRPKAEKIWGRVEEGLEGLGKSFFFQDKERIGEKMGDLLFSLANLARHWGLNAEDLLREANKKFLERFKKMERN
jgi:MazG family protein